MGFDTRQIFGSEYSLAPTPLEQTSPFALKYMQQPKTCGSDRLQDRWSELTVMGVDVDVSRRELLYSL